MIATTHFRQRVAERIGNDICPERLAAEMAHAIHHGLCDFVRFACYSRGGAKLYRIAITDKGTFYIVARGSALLTVLEPGTSIARSPKGKRKLLRA